MFYAFFSGLISFLLFTCSSQSQVITESSVTVTPKFEENPDFVDSSANNMHVILEKDAIYCYEGQNEKSAKLVTLTPQNTLRPWLAAMKNKYGNKMLVVIQFSDTNYKQIVGVLDEMTVGKIKDYKLIDSNKGKGTNVDPLK